MQKREWKDALNVLLSPQSPLKHPAEFLICRDICQIAPLILRGQSAQRDSHAKLTMLLNNLSCLDYYIAADGDNETAFSTLNRLFAALMLLGSLPIKRLAVYAPNFPKYYTNDYVASALCNFAVYLETFSLDKENHGTQYLKMAAELLHKSLETYKEKKQRLPHRISSLTLPLDIRRIINGKIAQLNTEISSRDPLFQPTPPPPEPKVIAAAKYNKICLLCFAVTFLITVALTSVYCITPTSTEQAAWDYLILNGKLFVLELTILLFCLSSSPPAAPAGKGAGSLFSSLLQTDKTKQRPYLSDHYRNEPNEVPHVTANAADTRQTSFLTPAEERLSQPSAHISPNTDKQSCIYCGCSKGIVRVNPAKANKYGTGGKNNNSIRITTDYYYKCSSCGVCFSRAEARRAAKNLHITAKVNPQNRNPEDDILQSAWKLMHKRQWDQALEVLFLQSFPFQHTLEFMVYRNICQAARLFIYPRTKWQAALLAFRSYDIIILRMRYEALDPFIDTMRDLDYYLPQNDNKETFRILKRLYEALSFFIDLPFKHYGDVPDNKKLSYSIIDHTHAKRIAMVNGFADFLKSKADQDPEHEAAYLNMARYLLNQCLTITLKINDEMRRVSLEAYSNKLSFVFEETHVHIEKQVELFNAWFSQHARSYAPVMLPAKTAKAPDLKSTAPQYSLTYSVITGLFGFLIIPTICSSLGTPLLCAMLGLQQSEAPQVSDFCFVVAVSIYSSYLSTRDSYHILLR